MHAEGTDGYDDYDLTYKSVSMDIKDKDVFTKMGFHCNQSIKNKSYDLKYAQFVILILRKISCDQAKIPYTEVYANSIGTTVENVRIQHSGKTMTIMGLSAQSSGINGIIVVVIAELGCPGKIAAVTIVIIVVVVLAILLLICWCKKTKN